MKQRGIYSITNLKTDRKLLLASDDITQSIINDRFALDMGRFFHKTLQREYTQTGLELFDFNLYCAVEKDRKLEDALREAKENPSLNLYPEE